MEQMALNAEVKCITPSIECKAGATSELTFDVLNTSDAALTLGVEPYGENKSWVTLADPEQAELELPGRGLQKVKVKVAVPAKTPGSSDTVSYSCKLRVHNAHQRGDAVESEAVAINVSAEKKEIVDDGGKKKNWVPIIIAAAVGGIVVIGGIVTLILVLTGGSSVPDLRGISPEQAATEFDLDPVVVEEVVTGELAAGMIVSQVPEAGADMPDDRTIEVVIEQVSVQVPGVRGLTVTAARASLNGAGLELGEQEVTVTGNSPGGTVIDQNPAEGALTIPGATVNITVERELAIVPPLRGETFINAKQALERLNLVIDQSSQVITGAAAGTVVTQRPDAGAQVEQGSTVSVDVEQQSVQVPDVRGQTREQAAFSLSQRQLLLAPVRSTFTGRQPIGRVESQDPAPNASVAVGSPVTVFVRSEPRIAVGVLQQVQKLQLTNALIRGTTTDTGGVRSVAPEEE
jgi:beta-lactam-binding protein with PASTA domain